MPIILYDRSYIRLLKDWKKADGSSADQTVLNCLEGLFLLRSGAAVKTNAITYSDDMKILEQYYQSRGGMAGVVMRLAGIRVKGQWLQCIVSCPFPDKGYQHPYVEENFEGEDDPTLKLITMHCGNGFFETEYPRNTEGVLDFAVGRSGWEGYVMTSDKAVEYFLNKDNKLPFVPDRAMEEKATDLLIQVQQGINYDNGETDSDFLAPPTLDYSARVFRRTLEHVPREDWDFALENFHESFVAHPQPVLNILGASGVSVTNEQLDAIFRDPED